MVNASCVDGSVVKAVQARCPDCWTSCPDHQGTNFPSACFLGCLFETLLGNATATPKVPAMTREEIMDPFVAAFGPPSKGGCPDAKPKAGSLADLIAEYAPTGLDRTDDVLDIRMSLW